MFYMYIYMYYTLIMMTNITICSATLHIMYDVAYLVNHEKQAPTMAFFLDFHFVSLGHS